MEKEIMPIKRRRIIFSHNDLDGVACVVIAQKLAEPNVRLTSKTCSYNTINTAIKDLIDTQEFLKYEKIYITDISINEELAERIDKDVDIRSRIVLIDHHASATWLNKYEWAQVNPELNGEPICAASLFFKYLINKKDSFESKSMYDLSYYVWLWDTWLWKTKYSHLTVSTTAVKLNSLFHLLGEELLIKEILDEDYQDVDTLLLKFRTVLDIDERQKNDYIIKKESQLRKIKIKDYNVGVVFADNYLSELGNALAEKHPEYDFIAMISGPTISFRSREESDIDLGALAKELFGGGGHPHAAGCTNPKVLEEAAMKVFLKH